MNCSTMSAAVNASNDISVSQITECKGLDGEAEEEKLKVVRVLKDVRSKRHFFR